MSALGLLYVRRTLKKKHRKNELLKVQSKVVPLNLSNHKKYRRYNCALCVLQ